MEVSRKEAEEYLEKAERKMRWVQRHQAEMKHAAHELIGGVAAFTTPLMVGLAEGRLATDGSGHVSLLGVPMMFGAGAAGVLASASGVLGEIGPFIGDAGKGCLGSHGGDLGRQIGLGWRLSAGLPVQQGALAPAREKAIREKAAKDNKSLPPAAEPAGGRVGAEPQRLTEAELANYVNQAPAAPPPA
jgi:hypothetical protein